MFKLFNYYNPPNNPLKTLQFGIGYGLFLPKDSKSTDKKIVIGVCNQYLE